MIKAQLTIHLRYDNASLPADQDGEQLVNELLNNAASRLAGEGLLSGDTALVIDEWSHEVDVMQYTTLSDAPAEPAEAEDDETCTNCDGDGWRQQTGAAPLRCHACNGTGKTYKENN